MGHASRRKTIRISQIIAVICCYYSSSLFRCAEAFPTYLLSKSNCWTELATDEVIMNHPVVAATDSDDTFMRIVIATVGDKDKKYEISDQNDQSIVSIKEFPAVVPLQVVTTNENTNQDYQYAMDVVGEGFFEGGSCEGKSRVAARGTETVHVTVNQPGASVVAAWAAGFEATRLTPILTFVQAADEAEKNLLEDSTRSRS